MLAENEAVVSDLNAHGGIAGRKAVPYYATLDPTSAQPIPAQEQAACAALTQDHKVFAVLAAEAHDDFIQCVQNAGATTVLDSGLTDANATVFSTYPTYVEPSGIDLDRLARVEVQALNAEGYFSPWNTLTGSPGTAAVKVGVVSYNDPRYEEAVDHSLLPDLAQLGHPVANQDVQLVVNAQTESHAGQQSAQIASAVLHLRQDGVTHVVFLEHGGLPVAFFLDEAHSQGYHPRYGLNSQDAPEALVQGGEVVSAQMNGAEGAGWIPAADLPFGTGQNPYLGSAVVQRCMSIMSHAGDAPTSADSLLMALSICDQLWFLKAAVESHGPALTRAALLSNVDQLGGSFSSALTLAQSLSASEHDGASEVRRYEYSTSCTCWVYSGQPIEAG